jgi:hypothetical protein
MQLAASLQLLIGQVLDPCSKARPGGGTKAGGEYRAKQGAIAAAAARVLKDTHVIFV